MEFYAENPWSSAWAGALGLELRSHSAAEYERMLMDAGFAETTSERLVDRRPRKPEADFEPSPYFSDYETYCKYLDTGALLVTGRKAGEEAGPEGGRRTAFSSDPAGFQV